MRIHAFLIAVGIATAITVIMTSTIVTQIFAIKYFFNCMTDSANRHGKLTLDDIHKCLYKRYSVNRKLPYGHPEAAVRTAATKPPLFYQNV